MNGAYDKQLLPLGSKVKIKIIVGMVKVSQNHKSWDHSTNCILLLHNYEIYTHTSK